MVDLRVERIVPDIRDYMQTIKLVTLIKRVHGPGVREWQGAEDPIVPILLIILTTIRQEPQGEQAGLNKDQSSEVEGWELEAEVRIEDGCRVVRGDVWVYEGGAEEGQGGTAGAGVLEEQLLQEGV